MHFDNVVYLSLRVGQGSQELIKALVNVGRLGCGALCQARPHLGVEGLAQVRGGPPHAAAPAVNGAAVAGGTKEVPQQG